MTGQINASQASKHALASLRLESQSESEKQKEKLNADLAGIITKLMNIPISTPANDKSIYDPLFNEAMKLVKLGADVNTRDEYGDTLLICASNLGRQDVVQELLNRSALVNVQGYAGNTALLKAGSRRYSNIDGDFNIVRMLVAAGANPNIKNLFGYNTYSVAKNNKAVLQAINDGLADLAAKEAMRAEVKQHTPLIPDLADI